MKKRLIICCAIILTVITFWSIYSSSDAADFAGTIVKIENTDDYMIFTVSENETMQYTVLADVHTDVYYCHLEQDIYLGDIKIGDEIQGTYEKWFSEDNYAENIIVQYIHED